MQWFWIVEVDSFGMLQIILIHSMCVVVSGLLVPCDSLVNLFFGEGALVNSLVFHWALSFYYKTKGSYGKYFE